MRYCFDLDGTLCTWETDGDYTRARPYHERIAEVNRLHERGHEIVICTARGAGTGTDWSDVTEDQLARWGVKHDELSFRKEHAHIYVDDRGISDKEFFGGGV